MNTNNIQNKIFPADYPHMAHFYFKKQCMIHRTSQHIAKSFRFCSNPNLKIKKLVYMQILFIITPFPSVISHDIFEQAVLRPAFTRQGISLPQNSYSYCCRLLELRLKAHWYKTKSPSQLTYQHWAGFTPYTSAFAFAESCVFDKQSLEHLSLRPTTTNGAGRASPNVTPS